MPDKNSFIVSFIVLPWYDEVQGHWQNWSCNLRNALTRNGKLVALGWKQPLQEKLDIFVRE